MFHTTLYVVISGSFTARKYFREHTYINVRSLLSELDLLSLSGFSRPGSSLALLVTWTKWNGPKRAQTVFPKTCLSKILLEMKNACFESYSTTTTSLLLSKSLPGDSVYVFQSVDVTYVTMISSLQAPSKTQKSHFCQLFYAVPPTS